MNTPGKPEERFQLGLKCFSQGKASEAEQFYREALGERPDFPEAHNHLGVALAARNLHDEAIQCFRQAILLKNDYADPHQNLGNSLRRVGSTRDALEHYREALRLKPGSADVHNNLGVALRTLGRLDEAVKHFRQALRINPNHIDVRNNLGVALAEQGLHKEATAMYRQVLRRKPQSAETYSNLGVVLVQQGKRDEAIECYRKALELHPNYADARNNLGNVLRHQGFLEEAESSLRIALELKPDYAEACNNLAIVLVKQERIEEAIANYQQALRLKPDYPDARKNLGLAYLACGNYSEGWPAYEWRWQTKEMTARKFSQPRWDGSPLAGKTILIYTEQGLGDTLQFIRYVALVEQRGGRVIVECQKSLMGLLARCPAIFRLVQSGETLPDFQVQAPLMSVPGILGTNAATIPASVPYLSAEPDRIRKWGEEFKGVTGFKIGIAWQGSTRYQDDSFRSIRLKNFEPLARIPGTRLVNLQKGFGAEQLGEFGAWNILDFGKRLDEKGAFLDTAAIMKHLDLVVSSDTSVAHLAGALGVPVWLALGKVADWRWLMQRDDSPWYPTMRLFRQSKRGEWRDVFERMAKELEMHPALETAERHVQNGTACLNHGKLAEAIVAFRRALELDPKNATVHHSLAIALEKEGKKDDAVASFREAIRLKPDYIDALHNLGNVFRRLRRFVEAEEEYRKTLKLAPNAPDVCNHMGIALLGQGKHQEAETHFRRALRLKPDHAEAHNNLGVFFEQQGKLAEAIQSYQETLRTKPDSPDTHKNLALAWLMSGDLARGWPEYEWRWKCKPTPPRAFAQPRWDGRPLFGQAVLLYAEQGLGDTIQFVRYASLVRQRGGVVLVECPSVLERLLARCSGIDRVIPQGAPLPDFAFQLPFLSLPTVFHTTLETVPAAVPYLSPEPLLIDAWGKELNGLNGLKIGIAWQGSKTYEGDAHRSIPLQEFGPLTKIPGVRLISLQKGFGTEQLRELGNDLNILDFGGRLDANGAFIDTAAIMAHLDLIVTSDTSVAHVAGALDVPTWLILGMAADWRWLRTGNTSPWYPSMRLFRQTRWGDWGSVFRKVASEIEQLSSTVRPLAAMTPGELLDKLALLEIKRERVQDEVTLRDIRIELGRLLALRARCMRPSSALSQLTAKLTSVNEQLCDLEDAINLEEANRDDGTRYNESARSIFKTNGEREAIKTQINQLLGSFKAT